MKQKRKRSDAKNKPIDLRLAKLPACALISMKNNNSKPVNKDARLIVSKLKKD